MASSFFFNGTLYSVPEVMSQVNDTAMAPSSLTVGNTLCLLGSCAGGQPQTPMKFSDPATALATLISGPLCDATVAAFNPSNQTNAPSQVMAVRVDQATPATATILDAASATLFTLTTNQYGLNANQTKYKIASGSVTGKAVTIQIGNNIATQDNITRQAMTVQYSGVAATASISITNSTVTLFAPNGTTVATIALASNPSVQNLADQINSVPFFSATVSPGVGGTPALNGLDFVTTQDVKTAPYPVMAGLQAIIDWINSAAEPYVTATRNPNVGTLPANIGFTFMTGGSVTPPVTLDWTTALTVLQGESVQWIVPLTGTAAVWAAVDAHCQFMSSAGRKERRALVGPSLGTTLAQVEAMPISINSDRTSLVWPGHYAFNSQGVRTLFDPYYSAAKVAAGFAGINPGDAMTNKSVTITGLEVPVPDPVATTALIQSGVLCLRQTPNGFQVTRSISTWLVNNNFNRVEVSCGAAVDFVMANIRAALQPLVGGRQDPLMLGRAINDTETALQQLAIPEPQGPGTIVGNENSPPFKNITASIAGDVLAVSFECSPVIPTNFIPVTVAVQPFSGTQAALTIGQTLTS